MAGPDTSRQYGGPVHSAGAAINNRYRKTGRDTLTVSASNKSGKTFTNHSRLFSIVLTIAILTGAFLSAPANALSAGTAIVLRSKDLKAYNHAIDGFVDECKKSGIIVKSVEDLNGRLKSGLKTIKKISRNHEKPDMFLAVGVLAATLAKKAFKDTPIIFCMVVNYNRFHLEGPNISGVPSEISENECLNIYKSAIGGIKNIGVIYDPAKTENLITRVINSAAESGLSLTCHRVKSARDVEISINNIVSAIDALWLLPDSTVVSKNTFSIIKDVTIKNNVPILCMSDMFVKAGALIGVFPDHYDMGAEAAKIGAEILKTKKGGYIRYPKKLNIAINKKSAAMMKLKISDDIKKNYNVIEYE